MGVGPAVAVGRADDAALELDTAGDVAGPGEQAARLKTSMPARNVMRRDMGVASSYPRSEQ